MEREVAALKFLDGLGAQLRDVRDPKQSLRLALRGTREFFEALQGCIAALQPGRPQANLLVMLPRDASWDLEALTRFIRHERPPVQPHLLIGPVRRRGGAWGAIAVMRARRPFDREDGRLLVRTAAALSDAIHQIDRDRILDVRDRIDRKIMEQIHPKDLFYQILGGLRSLTHYDHSSALFIRDEGDGALRLVAEQIAWKKARSRRIGLRLPILDADAAMLMSGRVYGFDRRDGGWQAWKNQPATRLAQMLDDDSTDPLGDEQVREDSILCAPLVTRDGLVGLLKIAARHAGQFKPYDADLVEHFRSQAAIAIQNLHRTESLRSRVVIAERKHAMADLARTVSHDVNNALGAMLPLVQQLQEDVLGGRLDPAVLFEDLEQLQKSLQVCRRIFGGMLSFSRGAARRIGHAQVRRAIDTASAILKYGLGRSGIELAIDVPEDLPSVACSQSDLEQVFLNLLTNAREAMPHGGRITIEARSVAHGVEIAVADSGSGIPEEHLPRVTEPFFTTKAHGNGLGLSICRSILWEVDGTIAIRSEAGKGTCVDIVLPEPQPRHV
ncbi:MAG TPA: ATP-binding protein [Vicinamibacterales bacterium]